MRTFMLALTVLLAACGAPGGLEKRDASPSPEEAQRAFEAGRAAARAGDFPRAVTLLSQAQRAAPYDPERLHQLALAHTGAGHEAAAIAWLEAYMATGPQGPNAAEAREEIARLQEKAVAKLNKLLEHALASAERLDREARKSPVSLIAWYHAMNGNLERAHKLNDSVGASSPPAWRARVQLLKDVGDLVAVGQIAAGAKEEERDEILLDAANSWSYSERWVDLAQAALTKASDKHARKNAVADRVRARALQRDVRLGKVQPNTSLQWSVKENVDHVLYAGVTRLLSEGKTREAAELAETMKDTGPRTNAFVDIALRQLEGGDAAGARSSARKAMTAAQYDWQRPVPAAILGQVDLSLKLINNEATWESWIKYDPDFRRVEALGRVAYAQALLGDMAGAEATTRSSAYRDVPPWGYYYLGRFHARKGRLREAFETVRRAPTVTQGDILEEIAERMMAQGDLAGAEEVLLSMPTQEAVPYRKVLGDWRLDVLRQTAGVAKLAEAHRAKQASDQEARVLRLASAVVLRSPYFCDEEVSAVLAKIARRQEELGDPDPLAVTRRLVASKDVRRWMELAYELSGTTFGYFGTFDLEADLKKAAEGDPRDLARAVAVAAHRSLQMPLARIEAARRNP